MQLEGYDSIGKYPTKDVIDYIFNPDEPDRPQFYVGIVKDINDPEKRGRIKVFIYGVHNKNEKEDNLPYISPLLNNGHSVILPEVNDYVIVMFRNNNIFDPVYLGVFLKQDFWQEYYPIENKDIIYNNRDTEGQEKIIRDKTKITTKIIKSNENSVLEQTEKGFKIQTYATGGNSSINTTTSNVQIKVGGLGGVPTQKIDTTKDKTVITNTLTSITQPVVLENKLKTFWQFIFKVFMDINWGIISSHMHVGQIAIAPGVPVTPAPGVPTPIVNTPTINNVKSDCLEAGTNNPIGT